MEKLNISLGSQIIKEFPEIKVGLLFLQNIEISKQELVQKLLNTYLKDLYKQDKRLNNRKITSWENIFSRKGINFKENIPSHISLLKRAISSGKLNSINDLVDLINYFSLKYINPIGLHDLDKINNIQIDLTKGDETYIPIGTAEKENVKAGEIAYLSEEKVLTRYMVWKQGEFSKIEPNSKNIILTFDDISNNFTYYEIEKIFQEIAQLISSLFGGETSYTIINKYNPIATINNFITIPKTDSFYLKNSLNNIVITDESKIDEVLTKGVKEIFPTKDELKSLMMSGKRLKIYTGIDPTANFIHMGHMIWMRKLSEFQKLGHEVIFLIGGFTAMIGDPDKIYAREPLTREQVEANFQNYKKDASKILNFDDPINPIQIKNNYDWLSPITLEKWLEIMSNVTLQHILSHDMFKERLSSQTPIRLHEILYPLMQGYDSVAMEVDLEVGGSDQTFNMLTGRILSKNLINKDKYVLTLKLLTDNSGKKMGKTTNNSISFKDSPDDVFGKVMSFSDTMLSDAYELLSSKSFSEIKELQKQITKEPMKIKKELALELTKLIHDENTAKNALNHFEEVIQNKQVPENIPEIKLDNLLKNNLIDTLILNKFSESKSEIRRLLEQGGIKLNDNKIDKLEDLKLISGDVMKIGKRKWVKFI